MPFYSDALSAVITYELLCVAAVLVFTLVRENRTCVCTFNLKLLRRFDLGMSYLT